MLFRVEAQIGNASNAAWPASAVSVLDCNSTQTTPWLNHDTMATCYAALAILLDIWACAMYASRGTPRGVRALPWPAALQLAVGRCT